MNFFYFFEDILTEGKYTADDKFEWIVSHLEEWLLNEFINSPWKVRSLPLFQEFKQWLQKNTTKETKTDDDMVLALDYIDRFLNQLDKKNAQLFLRGILQNFPNIKTKIARYGKPEDYVPGRRGRPAGAKNKPKPIKPQDILDKGNARVISRKPIDIPQPLSEPVIEPIKEPLKEPEVDITLGVKKKPGRPKLHTDDDLTTYERNKIKREGPLGIDKLEVQAKILNQQVKMMIDRINQINQDIERRKKFFGQ